MNNAIKFQVADRKPEIFIKTERQDEFIIISVKDNGLGVAPAQQDMIFAKYQRIDKAIEGSGIGLYLVKEIVTSSGEKSR